MRNSQCTISRCLIGLLLLFLPLLAFGKTYRPKDVPDPKQGGQWEYVSNPDGIIGGDDVAYLNKCARMLEEKTKAEMAVVAVQSIGSQDMFDFTYRLFQLWGVGKEGKNTGVLICFVLDSHDIRIMTGQGIEGVLPDAVCKRIIDEDMIPSFREGKYGEGLCLGALRIYEKCTSGDAPEELLNMKSVTRRNVPKEKHSWLGSLIGGKVKEVGMEILFVILVIITLIGLVWLAVYHSYKCPKCGKHTLSTRQKTLVAATYAAAGVGLTIKTCKHCGYKHEEKFTIPRLTKTTTTYTGGGHYGGSSRHSGGGFGGFSGGSWGGGSTMGGGAGGKW